MGIVQQLEIKAGLKILKPIGEVFEAIVDPGKMSGYFIASSTGRMETGKDLTWKFPEFDLKFPIKIKKVDSPDYISFYWDDIDGKEMLVEISLKEMEEQLQDFSHFVRVHHSYIVNLNEVVKYIRGEGGYLVMSDDSTVNVSRSRKDALMKWF